MVGVLAGLMTVMSWMPATYAETETPAGSDQGASSELLVIDRQTAMDMANDYSTGYSDLEQQIIDTKISTSGLIRGANMALDGKEQMKEAARALRQMGLPVPKSLDPDMTTEEEFNTYYALAIQAENVKLGIAQMENSLPSVKPQLESGVDQLLTNYFYVTDMLNNQLDYYKIQEDNFKQSKVKHDLGQMSDNDFLDAQANLENLNYQIKALVLNQESLDLNLRKLLGIQDGVKVTWEDSYLTDLDRTLEEYDVYKKLAFENSVALKNAKASLESAKAVKDFYMSALYDISNQMQGDVGIIEAQSKLDKVSLAVEKDIYKAYQKVLQTSKDLEVAQQTVIASQWQAKQAKASYDKGLMTESQLELAEFAVSNNQASANQLERHLVVALDDLMRTTITAGGSTSASGQSSGNAQMGGMAQ